MTGVEKRIVWEMLALPLETRAQLIEVLTQSIDESRKVDFEMFLQTIQGDEGNFDVKIDKD
jgi:hypothetical protein